MAVFIETDVITDPDQLGYEVNPASFVAGTEEILLDTTNKLISLKIGGNLKKAGATIKAVYSKLKDAWRVNTTLIKFPFPMGPITDEQFEMVNGWNWNKVGSVGIAVDTAAWASTSGGQITFTTTANHGIAVGDVITVAGITPTDYNGTYETLTGTTGTTIIVAKTADPGSYTSGGTISNYLVTTDLLRTGGWSVVSGATITEQWAGIITLGALGDPTTSTDQVYYQQVNSAQASVDFKLTGKVNQAVQIYSDPNADGNPADGFDRREYFKIFVREWQKLYAQSEIGDIGVTTKTFQAYRFPLTNSTDLKVTVTEVAVDSDSNGVPDQGVYANVNITYLRDSAGDLYNIIGAWVSGSNYLRGDVVSFGSPTTRWYELNVASLNNSTSDPAADTANWVAYTGERQIGAAYYPYTVVIDADTTVAATASGAARTTDIYTAVQYKLRQDLDIDESTGTVTGKTADSLLRFVGDTLVTSRGVYIDSFSAEDTNAITFTDASTATGIARTFPFLASLRVNFGQNLQDDQYAEYWVFFTSGVGAGVGNDFGTANAIIVKDGEGADMAGPVNNAWPTKRAFVSHTYNYDSNNQRSGGTFNTGSGSQGTDAPITAVAIGLNTSQYVSATGLIERSNANSVTLTSSLERNYSQGTTFP